MRLQLILALLALAPRAFAQEEADGAEASFRLYTDDDRTTVESWSAQAQKTVHGVAINAGAAPADCLLVRKPLAPEAGGTTHLGGVMFADTAEADYRGLLDWIAGAKGSP